MKRKDIPVITSANREIPATLVEVDGCNDRTCLILHGIFTTRHESGRFERLAERLANAGISSIRIDLAGHGDNPIKSDETSVSKMMCDIYETLQWLNNNGYRTIDVIASSFSGALLSLLAKALSGLDVDKLVMLNPVLDFDSVFINAERNEMRDVFNDSAIRGAWLNGMFEPVPGYFMSREFLADLSSMDVARAYKLLNKKHLVIFGTEDELVSFETAKNIVGTNSNASWYEIDGAVHAFMDPKHEIIAHSKTIEWLTDM